MTRHQVLVLAATAAVAALTTACGTAIGGDPLASSPITETASSTVEPDEAVPDHPQVNWDSPVVGGVEVTVETAQGVAGAAFDVEVPILRNGTLLMIQATDPERYPEDFRGYGVLYDVTTDDGQVVRLLIEETSVGPGEDELVRDLASNGPGYELEIVGGVEVAFIQPGERASAVFLRDGVKYNVNGPALPQSVVRDTVAEIIAQV